MLDPRLQDAPEEVKDVFAAARAALSGFGTTGILTEEGSRAVAEMVMLREELGLDKDGWPKRWSDPTYLGDGPWGA